jgi:hypothetical protein
MMSAEAGMVALKSGTTTVNSCTSSSLNLLLVDNGATSGSAVANVTSGSFSGRRLPTTANTATPWRLTITGSPTRIGGSDVFAAQVRAASVTFAADTYTGNLTTGVSASELTTVGAPVSLVLSSASRLSGPLTSNGQVAGTYTLVGGAANCSLG